MVLGERSIEDVGRATMLGLLSVLAIFASWGKGFVSVGLVVSVLGACLAWTGTAGRRTSCYPGRSTGSRLAW